MSKIIIGCRLPSGLVLDIGPEHPTVELKGQRDAQRGLAMIMLSSDDCGYTEVDASFWETFKKRVGENFEPLAKGVIFEAKNVREAKAIQKDLKDKKTGHEPMPKTDGKVKSDEPKNDPDKE